MPVIQCEHCSKKLRLPDGAEGRTVRCPECRQSFVAGAPAVADAAPAARETVAERETVTEREDDRGYEEVPDERDRDERPRSRRRDRDDDDDDRDRERRPSRRRDDDDDYERPRKKKKKKPVTAVNWKLIGGLGGLAAVVMVFVVILVVNALSDAIADDQWQVVEESGRFRVKMPGKAKRSSQAIPGSSIEMVQHQVEVGRNNEFIVGYSEGSLPPHRASLPADQLLNDSCDGSLAAISKQQPSERSRESIKLGNYPGKQMVVDVKNLKVTMVARIYLVGGRIYMMMAVGKKYSPDTPDVKKFFDSFEVLEADPTKGEDRPGKKEFENKPFEKPPLDNGGPFEKRPRPVPGEKKPVVKGPEERPHEEADPTVLGPREPDPKLAEKVEFVYLNDMSEFDAKGFPPYWGFGKNGRLGAQLNPESRSVVKGKNLEKTISTHPDSAGYARVCYALGKRAATFQGAAAISEDAPTERPGPTYWLILGDGKVLWRSPMIDKQGQIEEFSIDVSDVAILELRCFVQGSNHGSHALWVDPRVVMKKGK